jgi:hypothetical protein
MAENQIGTHFSEILSITFKKTSTSSSFGFDIGSQTDRLATFTQGIFYYSQNSYITEIETIFQNCFCSMRAFGPYSFHCISFV